MRAQLENWGIRYSLSLFFRKETKFEFATFHIPLHKRSLGLTKNYKFNNEWTNRLFVLVLFAMFSIAICSLSIANFEISSFFSTFSILPSALFVVVMYLTRSRAICEIFRNKFQHRAKVARSIIHRFIASLGAAIFARYHPCIKIRNKTVWICFHVSRAISKTSTMFVLSEKYVK